jgi:hypothetical protein
MGENIKTGLTNSVILVGGVIILILCLVPAAGASITYSDGIFNNTDWTVTYFAVITGETASGEQITSDGNPQPCRRIDNYIITGGGLIGFHLKTGATYNPATQGAISSINYSEDNKKVGTYVQAVGFALKQGDKYYYKSLGYTDIYSWTARKLTGLRAADFDCYGNPGEHPDFSASGGEITFGFLRNNSAGAGSNKHVYGLIDNWQVTVYPVIPLPLVPLLLLD